MEEDEPRRTFNINLCTHTHTHDKTRRGYVNWRVLCKSFSPPEQSVLNAIYLRNL